jgi:hypothetical protein
MDSSSRKGKKTPKIGQKVQTVKSQRPSAPLSLSPRELGDRVISHLRRGGSRRDIPFLLPDIRKKTQVVEARLTTDYTVITTVSATLYNTVRSLIFSNFGNSSDLANAFSECRFIRAKIYYIPRYVFTGLSTTAALLGVSGAAIDFANNTALTTSLSLLDRDNVIIFNLFAISSRLGMKTRFGLAQAIWDVIPEFVPSQTWEDTSATTAVCYWKPFILAADSTISTDVGYLVMEADWQFRGMR